jgi:prepilin-type N-terminal cleavage/methylation domain-containing protein
MLRRKPAAFTLVELLAVIGILAVLMMLLFPAVQGAREASRRTTCVSNQTRFALAMSNHDSRQGFLPGWRNSLVQSTGTAIQTTWLVPLLPLLERQDAYDGCVNSRYSLDAWGNTLNVPWLNFVKCPSAGVGYGSKIHTDAHRTSYSANAAGASESKTSGSPSLFNRDDGVIGDNVNGIQTSLVDVANADGLAFTLLIGETTGEAVTWLLVGNNMINSGSNTNIWPGDFGSNNGGMALGFPSSGIFGFSSVTPTTKVINPPRNPAGHNLRSYLVPSSGHADGAIVAFADGSTRFLKDSLAPNVFAHLMTSRSVWNAAGPANRKYSNNSVTANRYLLTGSGSSGPYTLHPQDY